MKGRQKLPDLRSTTSPLISDHEKFKNVLTGIQSLIIAVGIIVGGIWTARTFEIKKEAETAKKRYELAEIDLRKAEMELKKAEKELREKRIINITFNPSQLKTPEEKIRYIYALVEITNVGNHPETLDWQGPCFRARRIHFDDKGGMRIGPSSGDILTAAAGESAGCSVAPGEMIRLPCIARVEQPGLYHLKFTVNASQDEQKQASEEGLKSRAEWSGSAFILVQ